MNVYIDIIFAINLTMNTVIFVIVSKVSKLNQTFFRIAIGATVSAIIYCLLLVFFNLFFNVFTALGILILGLFTTFGKVKPKKFLQLVLYAHLVAFLIGGTALALYHYININTVFAVIRHFPIGFLISSIFISYITLYIGYIYIQKLKLTKKAIYTIEIFSDNESILFSALVDTGNNLTDPLNKWPVIIAEEEVMNDLVTIERIIEEKQDKLRMIPYKTVGSQGVLTGFIPDKIIITKDNNEKKEIKEVVIGLCQFNLSKIGAYQGLIGPNLLELKELSKSA